MMKKIYCLLIATICTVNLLAQEGNSDNLPWDSPNRFSIGPKVGISMSSMSGLSDEFNLNPKSGIGFLGGAAANFHFGRRTEASDGGTGLFGVQLEALYSQRTIKTDIENLKLSYLEIPILAQYYVLPELCIEAGPTLALALSSSPDEMTSSNQTIATGDIKGSDVMLTLGVGYKHKSGLTASARYNFGMSELAGNFDGKVSAFTISIGWMFSLIK